MAREMVMCPCGAEAPAWQSYRWAFCANCGRLICPQCQQDMEPDDDPLCMDCDVLYPNAADYETAMRQYRQEGAACGGRAGGAGRGVSEGSERETMPSDDYDFTDEVSARLLDCLWEYERAQGVSSTRALSEAIIEEWIQRQEAELPPAEPDADKG